MFWVPNMEFKRDGWRGQWSRIIFSSPLVLKQKSDSFFAMESVQQLQEVIPPLLPNRRRSLSLVDSIKEIPAKRVVLYSICAITLFAVIMITNIISKLLGDLVSNDRLWQYLSQRNTKITELQNDLSTVKNIPSLLKSLVHNVSHVETQAGN